MPNGLVCLRPLAVGHAVSACDEAPLSSSVSRPRSISQDFAFQVWGICYVLEQNPALRFFETGLLARGSGLRAEFDKNSRPPTLNPVDPLLTATNQGPFNFCNFGHVQTSCAACFGIRPEPPNSKIVQSVEGFCVITNSCLVSQPSQKAYISFSAPYITFQLRVLRRP